MISKKPEEVVVVPCFPFATYAGMISSRLSVSGSGGAWKRQFELYVMDCRRVMPGSVGGTGEQAFGEGFQQSSGPISAAVPTRQFAFSSAYAEVRASEGG
jgi:hypothetical protein